MSTAPSMGRLVSTTRYPLPPSHLLQSWKPPPKIHLVPWLRRHPISFNLQTNVALYLWSFRSSHPSILIWYLAGNVGVVSGISPPQNDRHADMSATTQTMSTTYPHNDWSWKKEAPLLCHSSILCRNTNFWEWNLLGNIIILIFLFVHFFCHFPIVWFLKQQG